MSTVLYIATFLVIFNGVHMSNAECNGTYGDANSNYVTYCDLNDTLRSQLVERFNQTNFHDFIAKVVRLEFHDCMGPLEYNMNSSKHISICDGCIGFDNGAHEGLPTNAVNRLEGIYNDPTNNWRNRISRADFWAASATIALQYSNYLSMTTDLHASTPNPNQSLPYIPFYIGRTDCSAAPDVNESNYAIPFQSFPDALAGWEKNYQLFKGSFGFSEREYTAILGAHTLGRVHLRLSGFGTVAGICIHCLSLSP